MTKNKLIRMIGSAAHVLCDRLLKQDNLPILTTWSFPFRIDFQKSKVHVRNSPNATKQKTRILFVNKYTV